MHTSNSNWHIIQFASTTSSWRTKNFLIISQQTRTSITWTYKNCGDFGRSSVFPYTSLFQTSGSTAAKSTPGLQENHEAKSWKQKTLQRGIHYDLIGQIVSIQCAKKIARFQDGMSWQSSMISGSIDDRIQAPYLFRLDFLGSSLKAVWKLWFLTPWKPTYGHTSESMTWAPQCLKDLNVIFG